MVKVVLDHDEYWLPSANVRGDEPYEGEVVHEMPRMLVRFEQLTFWLWRLSVRGMYRYAGKPYPR